VDQKARWRWIGALLAVVVIGAAVTAVTIVRGPFDWREQGLVADLGHPDLLIRSAKLSQLPKDLAQAPLLRGILTDDFVHYYEDHPTTLSVTGTFKRLAYDHPLSIGDRLIATVLDAPGEVALWRDGQGRPTHFALLLEHNLATRAVLELAKVGLPDKQLSVAGEVGGLLKKTRVYALRVDSRNTWLFATQGGRTVVLSHPGLLLENGTAMNGDAADAMARALTTAAGDESPFAKDFGLGAPRGVQQQIAAKTDFLGFGYQYFFPAVSALKTELNAQGRWTMAVQTDGAALGPWRAGAANLWRQLPRSNALCVALPVDVQRTRPLLDAVEIKGTHELLADVEPTGAMCWGAGGLFAPMLALPLKAGTGAKHDGVFDQVLTLVVRQPKRVASEAEAGANPTPAEPEPVKTETIKQPAGVLWTRTVAHEFGAVKQGDQRVDVLGIARVGDMLFASTDVRNLQAAMAVAGKTQPALSDQPMEGAAAVLAIDGPQLARLLEAETRRTLRPTLAPTFSRVARELLPPRLAAVSKLGRVQLGLPVSAVGAKGTQWVELQVGQTASAELPAAAASTPTPKPRGKTR
jgi:uncharacterized protein YfaA (DUF2138 family)